MTPSRVAALVAAVQLLAVAVASTSAFDGDLDPTFGIRGKVVTDFGSAAVVARMKRGDGACWEATYSTAVKNSFFSGLVAFSD